PLLLALPRAPPLPYTTLFRADYASWDQALLDSASYDRQDIVARIRAAELKVKRGEAADERDGVTFGEMQYSFPVLAVLCSAAARDRKSTRLNSSHEWSSYAVF